MPFISEQVLCCFLHNLERRTCIVVHPIVRFGQIWMQISVLYSARLTRIEYLDVQQQDRRVISACTASEGDVWYLLPLFCILSATGKSTDDHSLPPLPVLWWASDRMFRYWGVWIETPGGNDDGTRFLVGASWCHSVYSLALMWSARANSYWPTPCNLRCADLKKLFHRTNRWLAGLAGLACTSVADAKGAINLVSGWCNTSSCIMHLIQLHSYCQCIIWLYSMY